MKNKITIVLVLIMMMLPQMGSAAAAVLNEPQIQQDERHNSIYKKSAE